MSKIYKVVYVLLERILYQLRKEREIYSTFVVEQHIFSFFKLWKDHINCGIFETNDGVLKIFFVWTGTGLGFTFNLVVVLWCDWCCCWCCCCCGCCINRGKDNTLWLLLSVLGWFCVNGKLFEV